MRSRTNPLVVVTVLLLVLFLMTLALHLMMAQRAPAAQGSGEVQAATELLLKVLGGLTFLFLLYAVFSRMARRDRASNPGAIDAYQYGMQLLHEKEQELERLRAAAEARAQEIESYNENILRSVASGVITFNQDRVVTTFNEAAAGIWRLTREQVIGKPCAAVFGTQGVMTRLLERSLVHGEVITREEFELDIPRSGRIWVGVSASLLKDRSGNLIGTTFVCTDLTEIKALQAQVELRERMTVLGQMSAGIAHEFRNLMGTILGAAKLIARKLPGGDSIQENVQTITHVISDMDHLITQLLNFARKTEPDLKPVAVEPWLNRLVEQVVEQVPAPRHRIEVCCQPRLPDIRIDEVLMRQALGNLVQNAIESMPTSGRVTVSAGLSPAQGRRREIEFAVSDTGMGIPDSQRNRIFLPFYTTKRKGTGLGLALVHKIVLLHNGRIDVESREGEGTTFHIYLPVV